jgi:ABC-2 type transport system ATP-binding protein
MEIKLKETSSPQDLLPKLVGKISINKYEVKEPTLNAIFIEKVGGKEVKDEEDTSSH